MILEELYTEGLFARKYLKCKCDVCGAEFEADPGATEAVERLGINKHLCSENCYNLYQESSDETNLMS